MSYASGGPTPWPASVDDVLGRIAGCRILGGYGLLESCRKCDLEFSRTHVHFLTRGCVAASLPYESITAFEIGGPGRRQGRRFIGGGFGVAGAAEGILLASALNMLGSPTNADTVLCLQTANAELFLHLAGHAPDDVRMSLSPVFSIIRQKSAQAGKSTSPAGQPSLSIADELAKLAELKNAGVLTEEEFAAQKARLLA